MSERLERLEHALQRFLSERIHELKDPRIPLVVTVERVRLTPDLGQARVLVSTLGDEATQRETQDALNHASGFLQRALAHDLQLRRTPKLSFFTDPLEVL